MDSDRGKLFIGGISWETSEQRLQDYFSKYGEVVQTVIMKDRITGRARGFGFVAFADPAVLDSVLQEKHTIDGRVVEAKKAVPREEQHSAARFNNYNGSTNAGQGLGGGGGLRTKKIFVGGLPSSLTEEDFKKYFLQFGNITDVVVMYDHSTQRPRGFGFITFDTEDAVDRVLQKTFHELNEKLVEVKRALPKEASPGGGARIGGGAGGYQGYNNSGSNVGGYDGRMDNNRYGQPPAGRGGFASYGPTGYGAPGYGSGSYGPVNTGAYGYGSYGMNSYSGPPAAPGYVGAAGYGSAPVPNSGYGNGPIGAPRSPWGNQGGAGYGAQGNSAGYGGQAPWAPPAAPVGAAPGQSPSSGSGYTNPNYGYGYSNPDASYNNNAAAGYGPGRGGNTPPNYNVGGTGEQAGTGGAYAGGYGDAHGSSGYTDAVWKSGGADPTATGFTSTPAGVYGVPHADGTANGSAGYGGGYGSAGRQSQRP